MIMKRAALVTLVVVLSLLPAGVASAQTCPNPIDNPPNEFFVNQQYLDFLGRNATGFELANGVAPINSCYHAGNLACADRQRVLMSRSMWDHPEFRQQSRTFGLGLADYPLLYNNEDFVLLCYYIYLRRAPNAPPDNNYDGYNFWLNSLNNCTEPERLAGRNGNECYNQLINAFLKSIEYRARFGCT
jgi:hypothetical protein